MRTCVALRILLFAAVLTAGSTFRIFVLEPSRLEVLGVSPTPGSPFQVCEDPPQNNTLSNTHDRWFDVEHGQHTGHLHFLRALRNSSFLTTDVQTANRIFINLNCYFRQVLVANHPSLTEDTLASSARTCGRNASCASGDIQSLMSTVMQSRRWIASSGRDFILYGPHPLDIGLWSGIDVCAKSFQATLIVPEQVRCIDSMSFTFLHAQTIVSPYYSSIPLLPRCKSILKYPTLFRNKTLTAHATCGASNGKLMRAVVFRRLNEVYKTLNKSSEVSISCTSTSDRLSDDQYAELLFMSRFCLVLPGDSQSSRRLTDVIISGCVPVFVGPPFHTLPFLPLLKYEDMALFFHVKDSSAWFNARLPTNKPWQCPTPVLSPECWFDEASGLHGTVTYVNRVEDIPALLSALDPELLLNGVQQHKHIFTFTDVMTTKSAEYSILSSLRLLHFHAKIARFVDRQRPYGNSTSY